jgi:hypothetical protein
VTEPATPSLTVTPSTVLYRGEFQLSATGLGCRQAVEAVLTGGSGSDISLATLTADSDGSVGATLTLPAGAVAPFDYEVVLRSRDTNVRLASAALKVTTENGCPEGPWIVPPVGFIAPVMVSPDAVHPGGTIRISVTHTGCKAERKLVLRPGDIVLAEVTSDLDGNAQADVSVPGDIAPGAYTVVVLAKGGADMSESHPPATLTILGGSGSPPPTGGMPRAATDVPDQGGGGPAPWLAAGAALVLAAWGGAWIRRLALRR